MDSRRKAFTPQKKKESNFLNENKGMNNFMDESILGSDDECEKVIIDKTEYEEDQFL